MEQLFNKLYQLETLTEHESYGLFSEIIQGKLSDARLATVLISMKLRKETSEEISGAVQACLEHMIPFNAPSYPFADIVGTGGDGANTLNISTASAIVAASCGYKIAKHGNRGVSSLSGSTDLLQKLGINLNLTATESRALLDDLGLCFLFAPQYHAGFRHVMPVRQQLKTKTIFNVLGPLINPARPMYTLMGVYGEELLEPIAMTLKMLGIKRAAVIHGGGIYEVALHAPTKVVEVNNGNIESYTLNPSDFGLKSYTLDAIKGGTPDENKGAFLDLMKGKGNEAYAASIAANCALLFKLFGDENLKENAERALTAIYDGCAYKKLNELVEKGQSYEIHSA